MDGLPQFVSGRSAGQLPALRLALAVGVGRLVPVLRPAYPTLGLPLLRLYGGGSPATNR